MNSACEHLNQVLVNTISKLAQDKERVDQWDELTGSALMALRTMRNDAMKYMPAMLLYGQEIRTPRKRFAVGEQVLMKDQTPSSKFHPKWLGPMTVTKVTDYGVYYLAGLNSRKLQPTRGGQW
ncbi:hypothetical protein INT45_010824 [Circinella minor]|uniref:Uncharacterized protein n=1 Tax=Circinella minor TaxID=1195481 RepID=A0A8H7RFZ0_9FUNG|nr:hypothetical protein INT45_010824 [Circinella minor]